MRTIEIEEAVARMFGIRQHLIVPNICWGMGLHECDLLVVRRTGYAIEVEIKVSKSDLKKDAAKQHKHESNKIKELYYAVPRSLYETAETLVPENAGIITVSKFVKYTNDVEKNHAVILRPAIARKNARPLTESEINNVARLGCMRIWGLKAKLIRQQKAAKQALEKM